MMVVTSLERKTRGDVYGNVKKSLMITFLLAHGLQRTGQSVQQEDTSRR